MQSRAVQEIFRKGLREGEQKGLLEGEQRGLLKGLQDGLREGEQKKIQEAQQKILNKLEKRFGTVPSQTNALVQRFDTLDAVMEAFEVACTCEQIDEFIDYCRK